MGLRLPAWVREMWWELGVQPACAKILSRAKVPLDWRRRASALTQLREHYRWATTKRSPGWLLGECVAHHCSPTLSLPFLRPRPPCTFGAKRQGSKAVRSTHELLPSKMSSDMALPLTGAQRMPQLGRRGGTGTQKERQGDAYRQSVTTSVWAERMVLVACRLTLCMGGCWVREWSLGGAHQL